MRKKLLSIAFMAIMGFSFGQEGTFWSSSNKNVTTSNAIERYSELPRTKVYDLNLEGIKSALANAPERGLVARGQSNVILSFPNAKGEMERFRIFEAPVLHPDLAARYPNIKSYAGQGIDDPASVIRFSVSPLGLQSMRLSATNEAVFIEPITNDMGTYTVYQRSDRSVSFSNFECEVMDDVSSGVNSNTAARPNADDGILRTYRLAVSTTGEYTSFHGGTKAGALAAINTTMTRVNGIFENDFNVTMVLIANTDDVIYTNGSTDPYTNGGFNSQVQSTLTSVIGEANYDVGHLFARASDNGNAGCIGCICVNGQKGSAFTSRSTPVGDPFDVDYVAHELGHQFGANHTFSIRNEGTNAHFEPGSGTTIMGYAGITGATDVQSNSDPYFHWFSIQQVTNYVKSTSCQTNTNTGNNVPTANAGSDYTIPKGTPFVLTGSGSDADGDSITYCWEQADENNAATTYPSVTATAGVAFRSFSPTTSPNRYFPRLSTIKSGATSWQWEAVPNVARTLNFRLTVRDNRAGGAANNSDDMRVTVNGTAGPFVVNSPNTGVTWNAGTTQTVTWNVAGTTGNGVNAANVDILLSTDGGDTYPITLASNVTNDGSHDVVVPNNQGSQNRIMVKGANHIFFDISNANFTIAGQVACNATVPTGVAVSGVTTSGASVNWNAVTGATYDVRYRATGTSSWTTNAVSGNSTTLSGLTASTQYEVQVRSKCTSSNSSYSASVNFTTSDVPSVCSSAISSFPYGEGFESNDGWTQATGDDGNWVRKSGRTPSNGTGPTSATEGSFYMFLEASTNNSPGQIGNNATAILESDCFDLAGKTSASFSFKNHMYGNNVGTLTLEASTDGTSWTSIWTDSGNKGNQWNSVSVDLNSYLGDKVKLRFVGRTGNGWSSDIAIDDLSLTAGTGTSTDVDVTLTLNFDNYPEETSWEIRDSSNQIVASGGTYGSQADGSTLVITETLPVGCYSLVVKDTYGDGMCCAWGTGSYSLNEGSTVLASGASFGSTDTNNFCVGGATSRGDEIISTKDDDQIVFNVKMYPNPVAGDEIKLLLKDQGVQKATYTIRDLVGRNIQQGVIENKTINVASLPKGIYLIEISNGQNTVTKKVIRNK